MNKNLNESNPAAKGKRCKCGYLLNEHGECDLCRTHNQMGYRFCPRCQSEKPLAEFTDSATDGCATCRNHQPAQQQNPKGLPKESVNYPAYCSCGQPLNKQGRCVVCETLRLSEYKFCPCCRRDLPAQRFSDPADTRCNACIYACVTKGHCSVLKSLKQLKKKDSIWSQKQSKQAKIESLIAKFRQTTINKSKKRSR